MIIFDATEIPVVGKGHFQHDSWTADLESHPSKLK